MQNRVTDEYAPAIVPEGGPAVPPRISWGAVLAGGVVGVAVGLTLNILGAAVGASVIDVTGQETPDARSFGIVGGLWLLIANLIGLAMGGYVAARLSGTADRTDGVLHGLAVWATACLLAALLSGNVIAGTAARVSQAAGDALGAAAQGGGEALSNIAGPVAQQVDPRQVVERARIALRTGGDPAAMNSDQRNAEIVRLLTRRVTDGDLSQDDRARLAALIAAEYQVPPEEAQQRLQQVEAQATETAREVEQRARQAADAAATGAAVAAYWMFAALLFGAVAAIIGALLGSRRRVAIGHAALAPRASAITA